MQFASAMSREVQTEAAVAEVLDSPCRTLNGTTCTTLAWFLLLLIT